MDDLEMEETLKSSAGQPLLLGRSHDHRHVATVDDEEFAKTCDAKDHVSEITKENNSMMSSPSSQQEDLSHVLKQEDQLESTKAEISEMKEENEKLKTMLARIMKEYQSLQSHISHNIVQKEQSIEKSTHTAPCSSTHEEIEEPGFVSLSLGRTTSITTETKKDIKNSSNSIIISKAKEIIDQEFKQSLSLGLNCKLEVMSKPNLSSENSFDDPKEDNNQEQWQMSKDVNKSTIRSRDDDEVSQQLSNPVKKPRVSVRTRCETPTMNDGCQWRKYGQKTAKGNPCPRAYYRCTVASACPVRKQVQRCAEDMSILITTYEGNHNHALPIAATAMASTTSAAASMLMSGSSSTSRLSLGQPSSTISSTAVNNLHGVMNFNLSSGVLSKPFYLPNSTSSSISSSSTSHPTITLDLTTSSTSSASLLSSRSQHNFSTAPRYPSSTSFNFSSSSSSESNTTTLPLPINWNNNNGGFLSYGGSSTSTDHHQSYNKNQMGFYSLNHGKQTNQLQQSEQVFYQPYTKNNNKIPSPPRLSSTFSGTTLEAATKAITSDPSFQSALASAIKSIVGGNNGSGGADHHQTTLGNQGGGSDHGQNNLKWGTSTTTTTTTTSTDPFSSNIVPNLNFGQTFEQNSNGN